MRDAYIENWLLERGLTKWGIERARLRSTQTGKLIIPIFDARGNFLYNKYRRNPRKSSGAKYTFDPGAVSTLYGLSFLDKSQKSLVVCEGELDVLILMENGINAVCSTAGAATFKDEWFSLIQGYDTFFCFDNDAAGRNGLERVAQKHPEGKIRVISIPEELGNKADVTDVILKRGIGKFRELMRDFTYLQSRQPEKKEVRVSINKRSGSEVERARAYPIKNLVTFNERGYAKCIFHSERTPSMKIYADNHVYCFGCSKHADAIAVVREMHNLSFEDAVKMLI